MPYKKRYARKTRRRRKAPRRRRRARRKRSVWKTAVKAARSVVAKQATPLYYRKIYGTYSASTGLFSNEEDISRGPAGGYIDSMPFSSYIPDDPELGGTPGTRQDRQISVTGISFVGRIRLPQNLVKQKVKVYLFIDKQWASRDNNDPLLPTQFMAPDEFYMLRNEEDLLHEKQNISILKTVTMTLKSLPGSSGQNANNTFRDFKVWWKPRKPFKLRYVGHQGVDLLNRNFGVCLKASGTTPSSNQVCSFGGVCTTYYRDLA